MIQTTLSFTACSTPPPGVGYTPPKGGGKRVCLGATGGTRGTRGTGGTRGTRGANGTEEARGAKEAKEAKEAEGAKEVEGAEGAEGANDARESNPCFDLFSPALDEKVGILVILTEEDEGSPKLGNN